MRLGAAASSCWRSVLLNTITPAATTKKSCEGGKTGINSEPDSVTVPGEPQSMRRSWDEPPLWRRETPQCLGIIPAARSARGTLSMAGDIGPSVLQAAAGSCRPQKRPLMPLPWQTPATAHGTGWGRGWDDGEVKTGVRKGREGEQHQPRGLGCPQTSGVPPQFPTICRATAALALATALVALGPG